MQNLAMGGVVRQISVLADGLARRGHDVSVVALYSVDEKWRVVWNLPSIEISTLLGKKPSTALAPADLLRATLALRKLVRKKEIQVLYAYEGNIARFIGWLAAAGQRATKVVWGAQGAGQRNVREEYDWKLALPSHMCRSVSSFVPMLISNSEAGYRDRKESGYRCAAQMFIDNGFDVQRFQPDPQARARVRSEWKIGNEYLIGVVGRMAPSKGLPTLLRAGAQLAKKRKDFRLVFIGSGARDYVERLRIVAEDLGIRDLIVCVDAREDIEAVYNALDVLCLSAYAGEGFPNVIGEAMACGIPCVVTDVGDAAKIVGELGIVVPPENPAALAAALEAVLQNMSKFNNLNVRQRIVEHFPLEAMIEKTERVLEAVAKLDDV